ncbi:MAG: substrate-binding periplasmic protein [Oligoflexales bacterium]
MEYQWTQWKRGYEMAKSNSSSIIGSILYVKNKERQQDFYFSDPIIESQSVFFHLKSKPLLWETFDDLRGKNILVTRGYSYAELDPYLKKKEHFANIHETDNDLQGFTMLLRRSQAYDLLPINRIVGITTIRDNFSSEDANKFTFHPKKFGVVPLHLIIRKDKKLKKYIDAFNSGLKKLKASGKLDQYLQDSYKKAG